MPWLRPNRCATLAGIEIGALLNAMSRLASLLIVLMLMNSSYALEILSHDSHRHDMPVSEAMKVEHHVAGHNGQQVLDHGQNYANDRDTDCLCDDVCCLASAQLMSEPLFLPDPLSESEFQSPSNFYQSVALELNLPPPTH